MLIIGLTGGIASGKSLAARYFADLGVPIFDADSIARELVQPGQPALRRIIGTFGREFLTPAGHLDRARLRAVVFADPVQRGRLEDILHPPIRARLEAKVAQTDAPYCILCIPLLVETHQQDLVQRILVIDAPEDLRLERARMRGNQSTDEIKAIMAIQASRKQRLAMAHDVIVNDNGLELLRTKVEELHHYYWQLAGGPGNI